MRGDLLATSLAKPQNYYALRNDIIGSMTEAQVQTMYTVVWRCLRNGQKPNGDPITYKNASDTVTQAVFQVPEHIIGEYASKAAKTIENLMEDIIEQILCSLTKTKNNSLV